MSIDAVDPGTIRPVESDLSADENPADKTAFRNFAFFLLGSLLVGSFVGSLTGLKTTFLYKDVLGLSPGQVGTLQMITALPAYFQPFVGAATDLFPLLGFRRRTYYVLAQSVECIGLLLLGLLHQYHYATILGLTLLLASGGVLSTVVVNTVMVTVGNRTGRFAQFQGIGQFVPLVLGIVVTARLGGYVAQNWSYAAAFLTAAGLTVLRLPLALLLEDKRVGGRELAHDREAHQAAEREHRARSVAALRAAIRTPALWAIVGFVFYLIVTPGVYTAQVYYMTDVLHLDKQLIGSLGMYGAAGSLVAIGLYAAFARRLPVRSLVWCAWLMDCLSYPLSLLLHDRTSAMVLAFLLGLVGLLYGLSLNLLAARACPKNIEGTVYGLVMAAITFAGVLSEKIGGTLYDYFGPENKAHHYTLTHGWNWSLYFGFGFTILAVGFIPFLPAWTRSRIPISRMHELPETDMA